MDGSLNRPKPDRYRIAVIGTGISGLSAAWALSAAHHVTVYEKDDRIGGHCNTVDVATPSGSVSVDTGFIVYNEPNYPNLAALFEHLGVATRAGDMSFAVSTDGGFEYAGSLRGMLARRRNVLSSRFWSMVRDIRRFYRDAPRILDHPDGGTLTLGAYLDREGYSEAFVYDHILPMGAAIWSSPVAEMRNYPLASFLRFYVNHGLLKFRDRPQWRTVLGGSRAYVTALSASFARNIRTGCGVTAIARAARGILVTDDWGETRFYDHVVIASHADQALRTLADPTPAESDLLGAFRYSTNTAILHSDETLMPRRRATWSSWNYIREGHDADGPVCLTYWMNRLQGLECDRSLFVTLNPHRAPRPETVIRSFAYQHPIFDPAAIAAQRKLWHLQGVGNTWFCGSYFGSGFHEDGLQAGLAVAEALGGVRRPWRVADESGRIAIMPPSPAMLAPA